MTDICIPITHLGDNQIAEVVVSVGGIHKKHNFKVEAFPWNSKSNSEERILLLRRLIESYDKNWELVQIYNPGQAADFIHVLFRQRN